MAGALAGKTVLVTGSTRGIGRAIAERCVAEGARVAVNGREEKEVARVVEEIGAGAFAAAGDVADSKRAAAVVEAAKHAAGRVDVLVNNAGIALDQFVTRLSDEQWERVLATNLSGAFYLIRAVVPIMKEQSAGVILNVLSWAGLRGNVGQAAYSASKAGLHGLTLAMAKELAKFGIRVNGLAPAVPTDIAREMSEDLKKKVVQRTPLRRNGTLAEVAEGALFLVSDRSSFTTGQVLHVDGGIHLS
ncbi:MAG: SDR family NAD(P)-dependent oxidoreductase [Candidatus Binatia bacterium]